MPSSLFSCCFSRRVGSRRRTGTTDEQPREAGMSRGEAARAASESAADEMRPKSSTSITSRPEEPTSVPSPPGTSECVAEMAAQCYTIRRTGKATLAGLALIFSYNSPVEAQNEQSKCDAAILTRLFRNQLKFSAVHTFRNLGRAAVLAELEAVASADHSQWDCLAVISVQHRHSHSDSKHNNCTEPADVPATLSLVELISSFLASNVGSSSSIGVALNGKPKVFLTISHSNDTAPLLDTDKTSSALGIGEDFFICDYIGSGDACFACGCVRRLSDAVRISCSDIADALMLLRKRHQPPAVLPINTLTKRLVFVA